MSKAVLMSIQPKWCELIVNGKKTVEVRKTKPKLETPFKVYIYCTNSKRQYLRKVGTYVRETFITENRDVLGRTDKVKAVIGGKSTFWENGGYNGKVIGEFVCNEIEEYECEFYDDDEQPVFEAIYGYIFNDDAEDTFCYIETSNDRDNPDDCSLCENFCLSFQEIRKYMNFKSGKFYAWDISDLVIYDKPKELSEFKTFCKSYYDGDKCDDCEYFIDGDCYEYDESNCGCNGLKPIKRPPKSWCYVEEWSDT